MTINFDKWLQHELNLNRLATNTVNTVVAPNLSAVEKTIAQILNQYDVIASKSELSDVTKAIREQINAQPTWSITTVNLTEMATYEAVWQANFMGAAFANKMNLPSDSSIVRYVQQSIMSLTSGSRVDAGIWSKFTKDNLNSQNKLVNNIVVDGYAKGETGKQISKRIKETFDGTISRDAENLARTGYVHYASQASEAMIQDNLDIFKEYYYVTVFDNRTSKICIAIDRFNDPKLRYSVGDAKAPIPPLHYSCRTRRIAVTDGWKPNGNKGSVGGKSGANAEKSFDRRDKRADGNVVKYRGRKDNAFKAKPIKATTSRDTWLREQPRWFVEDSLGKGFAKSFLDDGVPLKSFSTLSGRPLTFAEFVAKG